MEEYARINQLESLAREYRRKNITEEEIEKNDILDMLMIELPYILKAEILNIAITGKTKSSKSTLMMWLLKYILNEYYQKEIEMKNICAEQYEFVRKVTDENIKDTIIGIDEYGAMEATGANASLDEKLLEQFSDIQAQREIHRIWCSPRTVQDKNSNIIIKIMSKDISTFTTHTMIYYKVEAPNEWYIQPIGRASFNLKDIIIDENGWKRLIQTYPEEYTEFKKKNKREDGFWEYIINKKRLKEFEGENSFNRFQTDIYRKYRKRKFLKFNLINKEGITRMREMVFAEIALEAYKSLKKTVCYINVGKDTIESRINIVLRKMKYPLTIYAMEIVKGTVSSLLSHEKTIRQLEIKKIKTKINEKKTISEAIKDSKDGLRLELEELIKLVRINKEYNAI